MDEFDLILDSGVTKPKDNADLDFLLEAGNEQRTASWFAQRRGKFTSSTFDALMTSANKPIAQSATAMKVVIKNALEVVTGEVKSFSSEATDHGTETEPEAIGEYQKKTGLIVSSTGFIQKDGFGGSPDGLVEIDGIIEVKCPFNLENHVHVIATGKHPKKYTYQIQGNLWVTGREWCDFITYAPNLPDASKIKIVRVYPDEELINALLKRLEEAEKEKKRIIEILTR